MKVDMPLNKKKTYAKTKHGFFSLSLAICPYQPLVLINPLDGIQCPHRADECKFLLAGFLLLLNTISYLKVLMV